MLLKLGAIGVLSYTTYRLAYIEKININKKFYDLMHELNLRNKGEQVFKIHKIHSTVYGYKVIVKNPTGFSSEILEKNKDKLISCFNCDIDIKEDKAYTKLDLIYTPLNNIKYNPIKCNTNELILGYNYKQHLKVDMNVMPHLLIAGINGSGKTRFLYSILTNLIYNSNVNLHFSQILKSDLEIFKNSKVVKNRTRSIEESFDLFNKLNNEMERRIAVFDKLIDKKILNIESYNNIMPKKMTYEYLVLEEFSDFMPSEADTKEIKNIKNKCLALLERLIKASRSTGIFLIICLQSTTKDQMPVFLRKQCNVRVTFRQSEDLASQNIIGTNEAVGLPRGEFIMISDKKHKGKSYLINFDNIDSAINHTIVANPKETLNTPANVKCEKVECIELTKQQVKEIKEKWECKKKKQNLKPIPNNLDGIRRVNL